VLWFPLEFITGGALLLWSPLVSVEVGEETNSTRYTSIKYHEWRKKCLNHRSAQTDGSTGSRHTNSQSGAKIPVDEHKLNLSYWIGRWEQRKGESVKRSKQSDQSPRPRRHPPPCIDMTSARHTCLGQWLGGAYLLNYCAGFWTENSDVHQKSTYVCVHMTLINRYCS
jgi:hypothetical protein